MNGYVDKAKMAAKRNVLTPMVVSSAIGALAAGVAITLAMKSGVKPLKKAATAAKGGK